MDIGSRIKELGPVDCTALREAILNQEPRAWQEQTHRQQEYDVHRQTESIVLVFAKLDAWPQVEICEEPGWDRLAGTAVPVMRGIIEKHYPPGGAIIRAMAAKLLAGSKISPHRDSHPSFHRGHRIHVPITTNPGVRIMIDGRPYRLKVGEAYEINNQMNHSVLNTGDDDRITFIFDYVPPAALGRGRASRRQTGRTDHFDDQIGAPGAGQTDT